MLNYKFAVSHTNVIDETDLSHRQKWQVDGDDVTETLHLVAKHDVMDTNNRQIAG